MPVDTLHQPHHRPPVGASRLARLFVVRQRERATVMYFLAFFVVVGAGMALGRGSTDALFFKRYGIEYLPLMFVMLSGLLATVSAVYAAFVDQVPAERCFRVLFFALMVVLVVAWGLMTFTGVQFIYPVYFLVYEVASELLLVHSSFYLAQNLDTLQAKRLSPLVFAGSQIGMLVGGLLLALLAEPMGVTHILLLWAGLALLGMVLLQRWHGPRGASAFFRTPRRRTGIRHSLSQIGQGLRFTRDSALLRSAALALFFMVIMFYILAYAVNRVYTETFASEESLTAFFGLLLTINSTLSLLLQFFVTGRVIERLGLRRANLFFPATSVLSFVALLAHFGLPSAVAGSLNKDTVMPAFRNPVATLFFNALPQCMQGRARSMAVVLVMPLALLVCGAILWLTQRLEAPVFFLVPGLLAAVLFLYFSRQMNRAYVTTLVSHLRERLYVPDQAKVLDVRSGGEAVLATLAAGVAHMDEQVVLSFARALAASFPERAPEVVLARARRSSPPLADQLIKLIAPLAPTALQSFLREHGTGDDDHLRATCLANLFLQADPSARPEVQSALRNENARLRAAGIRGTLRYPIEALREEALRRWRDLLGGSTPERLAALDLIPELSLLPVGDAGALCALYPEVLLRLLRGGDHDVAARALASFVAWRGSDLPELEEELMRSLDQPDPSMRSAAVGCLRFLPQSRRMAGLERALEDAHRNVRLAAIAVLRETQPPFEDWARRWVVDENRGSPRAQQAVLDALLEQGLQNPVLEQIVSAKTQSAQWMSAALATVAGAAKPDRPALGVLVTLLGERVRGLANVALTAMEPLSDGATIATLRSALNSGDKRYMASACEALRNLDNMRIAQRLGALLEGDHRGSGRSSQRPVFADVEEALTWCHSQADAWLSACARGAMRELRTDEA